MTAVLTLQNIDKDYHQGEQVVSVLKDASLSVEKAQMVALTGPSGSGKSTLLHVAGLLDVPTKGHIFMHGEDVTKASDAHRSALRAQHIGFIFQDHHLLPEFTALENVTLAGLLKGDKKQKAVEKARHWLLKVGLEHRLDHKPDALSGGERQRVAIARALVNEPQLILADEPTGNLDPDTSSHVFDLLVKVMKEVNISLLIATHNFDLASQMGAVYHIENGHIEQGLMQRTT